MRIAHFLLGRCNPQATLNSVEQVVYQLVRHQATLGHPTALYSLTEKPPIPIPGVEVLAFPPRRFPFSLPKALLTSLLNWAPDVVHLHQIHIKPNAPLARWLRRQGIPYVTTPHGSMVPDVVRRGRWYLKIPYKLLVERPMHNRAAFVHAIADEHNIRNYGITAPIVIAQNGIDVAAVPDRLDRDRLADRFPDLAGQLVFLYLGRLEAEQKSIDVLVEGFARADIGSSRLVLVGPEHRLTHDTIGEWARRYGISSKIHLVGPVLGNDRFDYLAGADVFVHPSRWEAGVPLSVLEAAASAKPSLLSTASDPRSEFVANGAALHAAPEAPSIADALNRFAAMSHEDLVAMGEKAQRLVTDRFGWEDTAATLVEGYQRYARQT